MCIDINLLSNVIDHLNAKLDFLYDNYKNWLERLWWLKEKWYLCMITINCLLRNSRISLTHWGVKGRVLLFERDERKGDLLQKVFSFWELVQTDLWSYVKAMANLIVALCDDAFTIFCMDLQSFTRKCNSKFESGLCSFRSESVHSVEEPLVPTIVSDLVSLPCHFCVPYIDKHL